MIEIQAIFREYGEEFLRSHPLNTVQFKAYRSILNCRTAALGGHIDICDACGFQRISYNSCRNRHCPKCQTMAKEQWIENQERYLLNVGYFHVVFTVPSELNLVFRQNQEVMYNLFFKSVSETLRDVHSASTSILKLSSKQSSAAALSSSCFWKEDAMTPSFISWSFETVLFCSISPALPCSSRLHG